MATKAVKEIGRGASVNIMSWFTKITKLFKKASLRGEWFIESGGYAQSADGEIDDVNHEVAALQAKIPEELWEKYDRKKLTKRERKEIGEDFLQFMESGGEAREYMVTHEGWIRVHGNNFELWKLDESILSNIVNFLGEELQSEDEEELAEEEIVVDELSTGRFYAFYVQQLFNAQETGTLNNFLLRFQAPTADASKEKAQKLQIEHQNLLMNEGMNLLQQVNQQYGNRYNIISQQLKNKSPQNINSQISFWRMLLQKYSEFSQLDDNQFLLELQNILQYY